MPFSIFLKEIEFFYRYDIKENLRLISTKKVVTLWPTAITSDLQVDCCIESVGGGKIARRTTTRRLPM